MTDNQTEQRVARIVRLFFYGGHPQRLTDEVHRWLASDVHEKEKDMALRDIWDEMIQPDNDPTKESYRDTYRSYKKLTQRLGIPNVEKKPVVALGRIAAKVAAVLVPVALVAGAYLIWGRADDSAVYADVTVETADGQQRRVVLPDGSEVWLNGGSRLNYASDFADGRSVELSGEAFFSVRKAEGTPFIVRADRLSVKVLGTEFNVESHENSGTSEVTLLSGSVEVASKRRVARLQPGQTLTMERQTSKMTVSPTGTDNGMGWQPARLSFSNTPLSETFRTLGIYYDMPVEVVGVMPQNRVTVNFRSGEEIENVLYILQNTTQAFDYTVGDGRIKITAR